MPKIVIKNEEFEGLMNSQGVNNLFGQHLPARLSYPLACMMKVVRDNFDTFMEEKMKIIEKHCDRDEKAQPVKNDKNQFTFTDTADGFVKDYDELLALTTKIKYDKIEIDVAYLEENNIRLSPKEMLELDSLITFSDSEAKSKKVVPIKDKKKGAKSRKN